MSYSEMSNIFEKLDSTEFVTSERQDGESYISLTSTGEAKVFERDTGSAGSGGGDDHRWVLREAFTAFTKVGYETWLPEQDGGELPDGVGDAPIDVDNIDDSLSGNDLIERIEEKKDRLKEQYPAVWNLAGADDLSIEAETSTLKTPFQTFNNLNKSKREGNLCVFALKDESANKDEFEYWGRRAEQAIYESVRDGRSAKIISHELSWMKTRPNEDSNPRYYTYLAGNYKLDEEKTALRPASDVEQVVWYYDTETGEVVAAPADNETIVENGDEIRFDDPQAVEDGDPTAVPAYYEYDQSEQEYVVNASGEKLYYATREEMEEDWETFKGAWIPENEFEEMPDEDDFIFVIFPDADNPEYDQPQIYERGECKPLFDTLGVSASMPDWGNDIQNVDAEEIDTDSVDVVDSEPESGGNDTPEAETLEEPSNQQGSGSEAATAADQATLEDASNVEANGSESAATDNTATAEGESRPRPTNISPYNLAENQFCDVEQGTLGAIATKTILPEKGPERYENIVECIGYIDKPTARYIDGPEDLADVLGNAQLDRDEIEAAAEAETEAEAEAAQEATSQTPTPEESSIGTPEASTTASDTGSVDVADTEPGTLEGDSNLQTSESESEPTPAAADQGTLEGDSNVGTPETESPEQPTSTSTPTESQLGDDSSETPVVDPDEIGGDEEPTETRSTPENDPQPESKTGGEGQRKTTDTKRDAESDQHSPTTAATEAEAKTDPESIDIPQHEPPSFAQNIERSDSGEGEETTEQESGVDEDESESESVDIDIPQHEPPSFANIDTADTTTNTEDTIESDTVESTVDDSPTPTDAQHAENKASSTETINPRLTNKRKLGHHSAIQRAT